MSFITSPGVIFPPLTAGGVAYGTGSQAKVNTAGILGQYLISGGAGVPTFTNLGTFTTINCTNLVSSGTLASSFTVTSGTAVPLRITNEGTGNSFVVEDSANPDVSPFLIDAAGNVGAGLAPTTKLQVYGAGTTAAFYTNSDASGSTALLQSSGGAAGDGGQILFGASFGVFAGIKGFLTNGTGPAGSLIFQTRTTSGNVIERMRIDSAGNVGIGGTAGAGSTVWNIKNITGATTAIAYDAVGTVQSDVTSAAVGYRTSLSTQASAFTLTDFRHFSANQSTIGATSVVTTQAGFHVPSNLTGATNNFGVYSNIASTANRYNFYAAGTADNYFAGSVGIGAVLFTGAKVVVGGSATGSTTVYGVVNNQTIQPDVTANALFFATSAATAASVTLTSLFHYNAAQATFSGTSVTSQYGFVAASSLTGATNNYGVYSNIASTANRWNFYANGTARNYMAADLTVNGATAIPAGGTAGAGLMVSTTANFGVFFGSGAPTLTAAKGSLYLRSDGTTINDRMYVNTNGSTTWTNVVTAA
jgi:hypothetical protein